MKFAVLVFPGSSELDCCRQWRNVQANCGMRMAYRRGFVVLMTADHSGGFSYGDYVRPGAIASLAPVMKAVKRKRSAGALILGIGNGLSDFAGERVCCLERSCVIRR